MIRVFDRPASEDLLPFSGFLWGQEIPHRIIEEVGRQVLWLEDEQHLEQVKEWFAQWQSGAMTITKVRVEDDQKPKAKLISGPLADWRKIPATLTLIAISLVVALVTGLGDNVDTIGWFTISPFEIVGESVYYWSLPQVIASGELWRLFSPAFIHFGLFHLLFNMMWLLDLGWYIERRHGHLFLLLLVLVTAAVGNICEFTFSEGSLFIGGMSGAIYGLLGFCWMRKKQEPKTFNLPSGVYTFMMVWLLIGFTGLLKLFGFGSIANIAHGSGLLSGVALGWLYNMLFVRRLSH